MYQAMLITIDPALHPPCRQLAARLGMELQIVETIEESIAISADLLLWHTTLSYAEDVYQYLINHYPRVVILRDRSGERLGPLKPFRPFIILPFEVEEAYMVIRDTFDWPKHEQ